MNLPDFHPVKNAERVCIHKWAFTTARTISLGAGGAVKIDPYFSFSDAMILLKYNWHAAHQFLIRRIVLISQYTSAVSPAMTFSYVSALRLL